MTVALPKHGAVALAGASVHDAVAERIRSRRLPEPEVCQLLRRNAGLTQRDLAQICGVSPATIHFWEHGQRRPTGKRLALYAEALRAMREAS